MPRPGPRRPLATTPDESQETRSRHIRDSPLTRSQTASYVNNSATVSQRFPPACSVSTSSTTWTWIWKCFSPPRTLRSSTPRRIPVAQTTTRMRSRGARAEADGSGSLVVTSPAEGRIGTSRRPACGGLGPATPGTAPTGPLACIDICIDTFGGCMCGSRARSARSLRGPPGCARTGDLLRWVLDHTRDGSPWKKSS